MHSWRRTEQRQEPQRRRSFWKDIARARRRLLRTPSAQRERPEAGERPPSPPVSVRSSGFWCHAHTANNFSSINCG